METFSGSGCIRFGWETFKKRPWLLMGAPLLAYVISWVLNGVFSHITVSLPAAGLVAFIVSVVVSSLVNLGIISFILKAHDDVAAVKLSDLWRPQVFLNYFAASVLVGLAIILGFILLIIPGIIAALALCFVSYLIVDKGLGPVEAMKESARITKGHRMDLAVLCLLSGCVVLLGFIALFVGVLVALPVVYLAMAHAYRTLSAQAAAPAPAVQA